MIRKGGPRRTIDCGGEIINFLAAGQADGNRNRHWMPLYNGQAAIPWIAAIAHVQTTFIARRKS
jgi:hypothetical protein